ncbi:hypothetical protein [Psychroserpens sp. NJDZ02]|uniref:hypothetical protein n=1 Tax=Psychroserpens sp. NJDZ02 TaxID=2570561 RepID=UPI0010A7DEE0|nr:hypothetical protein [Psychroserpens sp. NJDZ02]QCE43182.1 hypothetical protein E9099_17750 [Psychroserpens sp. NJDZ02]
MQKKALILSILYIIVILTLTFNIYKTDSTSILIIALVNAVFFIFFIRKIYKKYSDNYALKNNQINFKNSNAENLKKISTKPFLFGLENKVIDDYAFYFDDENFYAINKKSQKSIFKLTDITEVSKTFFTVNNRRIWQIKIKPPGNIKEEHYKFAHNYSIWNNNFPLFHKKMNLINPSIIKTKWRIWSR